MTARLRVYVLCLLALASGHPAAAQIRPPGTSVAKPVGRLMQAGAHGSWQRSAPGFYTISICPDGCEITGAPSSYVALTIEAWGAGGGGTSGGTSNGSGGHGGGGGGGGAYLKIINQFMVAADGSTTTLHITVGAGGTGGQAGGWTTGAAGQAGGATIVAMSHGSKIVAVGGGAGGAGSNSGSGGSGIPGGGGFPTRGADGSNGAVVNTCNGGAGGSGGGSGPGGSVAGRGGAGGHGGYYRSKTFPTCLAKADNENLTVGSAGAPGMVKLTW